MKRKKICSPDRRIPRDRRSRQDVNEAAYAELDKTQLMLTSILNSSESFHGATANDSCNNGTNRVAKRGGTAYSELHITTTPIPCLGRIARCVRVFS